MQPGDVESSRSARQANFSSVVIAVSVVEAVQGELAELRKLSPELADGAVAASAVVLAAELDKPRNSATAKSMCARALREAMDRLRELAPADEKKDDLDDLTARRNARLAGRSAP